MSAGRAEFVPGSGVPEYGGRAVGVPDNSILYVDMRGKNGRVQTRAAAGFLEENTKEAFYNILGGRRSDITWLQQQFIAKGFMSESDIDGQWGFATNEKTQQVLANLMQQGNLSGVSWQSYLAGTSDVSSALTTRGGGGGGGAGGGLSYPYTTRQQNIALTTRGDAKMLLAQAMQQLLGRNPSNDEVRGFVKQLHDEERDNPTITTTDVMSGTETSTTTRGGVNQAVYAEQWVEEEFPKANREYEQGRYEQMALNILRSE